MQTEPRPAPPIPDLELPPDEVGFRMKSKLLGPALPTEDLEHERLGKPTALAVFASDNLSSSAYAKRSRNRKRRIYHSRTSTERRSN